MARQPIATVAIPVYNGGPLFLEALRSVQDQSTADIEILVADNASTDGTTEAALAAAADDNRVRVLTADTNRGAAWNFNRCVGEAAAPYFRWHAADDVVAPGHLDACLAVLDADPTVVLAHTEAIDIDGTGTEIHRWTPNHRATDPDPAERFHDIVHNEKEALTVFGLARTDAIAATQLIGPYTGSDWVILAELALHGRFEQIPEPLFLHREHENRSVRQYHNHGERMEWFDTRLAGKPGMPRTSVVRGHLMAAMRGPTSPAVKARCLWSLAQWTWPQKRRVVREITGAIRHRINEVRS